MECDGGKQSILGKGDTITQLVYSQQVHSLLRYLQSGQVPEELSVTALEPEEEGLIDLGTLDLLLSLEEVKLKELVADPAARRTVRKVAQEEGVYDPVTRTITVECLLTAHLQYPLALLADDVLVLHRLRALVSNFWHPHHAGNSFAWEGEQTLAFWFSRSEMSRLTGLEQAIIWSPTVNLLQHLGIDLAGWAEIESPEGEKLPETPALQWVQQHHVMAHLFPDAQWLGNENWIEQAVGYALHMLALLRDQSLSPIRSEAAARAGVSGAKHQRSM